MHNRYRGTKRFGWAARVGSWNTTDDKCKCVYRGTASPDAPDYTEDDIGFRIVCRP